MSGSRANNYFDRGKSAFNQSGLSLSSKLDGKNKGQLGDVFH